MNKNENKKKQFVVIVLSVLAVCLVAGLFWKTSTAKGKQDVPAVQDGEEDSGSGKRADAGGGKDATPVPTVPGDMTGQPEDEEKGEGTGELPTPTESVTKPEEENGGSGESSPAPIQTVEDGTAQPEEDDKGKEDVDANPDAGDGTVGAEKPGKMQNPEVADTVLKPSPEVVPTKAPETPNVPGQQEKTDNKPESGSAANTKTDEGKDEDLNCRVNSPDEATPPPNPPVDDKNTAPVENPDGDGNCRPEQWEVEKEESSSKGESTKNNEPSKKDDSSKGEPPSEGAIYVPGFGWIEYEGENSYDIAPNAGTGDIIGDM